MNNLNRFESDPLPSSATVNQPALWLCGLDTDAAVGPGHCPICSSYLSGTYYRVDGQMACAVCAIQARARQTRKVVLSRLLALAICALLASLTLPFLGKQNLLQEAIAFFVVFICVRIAWQLTAGRRLHLDGPYSGC